MPYRTEARIEPPNNGSRARHAVLHVASECLTHRITWARPFCVEWNVKPLLNQMSFIVASQCCEDSRSECICAVECVVELSWSEHDADPTVVFVSDSVDKIK